MAHHDPGAARLGARVLITEGWYKSLPCRPCVPRTRGDEPVAGETEKLGAKCSPHPRG